MINFVSDLSILFYVSNREVVSKQKHCNKESKQQNEIAQGCTQFWCLIGGDGPPVDFILQKCAGTVVWGTLLTQENIDDLERTQKTFAKLVLRKKYKDFNCALILINLDSLQMRRQEMCLKFAKSGIKNGKLNDVFPINNKINNMKTREDDKFQVQFANTGRLKQSSIITMQNMLNSDAKKNAIS